MDIIEFRIRGDCMEIGEQAFHLGELTCDMLSITPGEFDRIYSLVKQLKGQETLEAIWELQTFFSGLKLFQALNMAEQWETVEQYEAIVANIYAFNQTMFWFIDQYLTHLIKLDAENAAAALFDFYTAPNLEKMMVMPFANSGTPYTTSDGWEVQYVPREIPGQPEHYAIYEEFSVYRLQSLLKVDFMKALMAGHFIRRCQYCKRFFLLTKGYRTAYCDRPLPDNPRLTCRNRGSKVLAKEKAMNNPVIHSYERAYQRVRADRLRGRITSEEGEAAKRRLRDLRDMAVSGRFSDAAVDEQMQPEPLYGSLGIVRKGGRKKAGG